RPSTWRARCSSPNRGTAGEPLRSVAWRLFAMKLALALSALGLMTAFVAGCSSEDDPAEKTGPVAGTPLTGSIEGKTFEAKSAVAGKGFEDGEKSIDIDDSAVTCKDFSPKAERMVMISV